MTNVKEIKVGTIYTGTGTCGMSNNMSITGVLKEMTPHHDEALLEDFFGRVHSVSYKSLVEDTYKVKGTLRREEIEYNVMYYVEVENCCNLLLHSNVFNDYHYSELDTLVGTKLTCEIMVWNYLANSRTVKYRVIKLK